MMHYRRLGETGLMVSEVGMGGAGIGHVWGPTTADDAIAAVHAALQAGVNFFAVAATYGDGLAERLLGQALAQDRDRAVIATKVYLAPADLAGIPGAIERSLARSLERLNTGHIDLFQLHNHVTARRGEIRDSLSLHDVLGEGGVVETLQRLKQSDAVRFIGFTGLGQAAAVRSVIQGGGLDTVQAYYNLLNRSAAEPLPPHSGLHDHGQIIPLAVQHGLAVIGIRNLAGGVLSAGLDRDIPPQSLFARDARRVARLHFLRQHELPLSQLATRFVLAQRHIATVVPGAKNAAEIEDAIAAAAHPPLEEAQIAQLDDAAADDFGVPEPEPTPL